MRSNRQGLVKTKAGCEVPRLAEARDRAAVGVALIAAGVIASGANARQPAIVVRGHSAEIGIGGGLPDAYRIQRQTNDGGPIELSDERAWGPMGPERLSSHVTIGFSSAFAPTVLAAWFSGSGERSQENCNCSVGCNASINASGSARYQFDVTRSCEFELYYDGALIYGSQYPGLAGAVQSLTGGFVGLELGLNAHYQSGPGNPIISIPGSYPGSGSIRGVLLAGAYSASMTIGSSADRPCPGYTAAFAATGLGAFSVGVPCIDVAGQPVPVTAPIGGGADFDCDVAGSFHGGQLVYQWQWRNSPACPWIRVRPTSAENLASACHAGTSTVVAFDATGADTSSLRVGVTSGTVFRGGVAQVEFRLAASNDCETIYSNPAPLVVVECATDFNADGFLDFFDYDDFVQCFESGSCPPGASADFNGDGFADFFDYDDFVRTFEEGC